MIENGTNRYWSRHPLLQERHAEFLGCPIHLLTMHETLACAEEAMAKGVPLHHTVINVSKVVNLQSDAELRGDVSEADLINIDGMGVLWGARLCGVEAPERVTGIDLMERIFALCEERGFRPYLLGAERNVLESVTERLKRERPALVLAGSHDGYFTPESEATIVAEIAASGADCLFVAMPSPRKERFLRKWREQIPASFIMGVGGSFDVYGGKVRRAPVAMQRLGLEWLYRLLQEPDRLWRRYYETNIRYIALLAREVSRRSIKGR